MRRGCKGPGRKSEALGAVKCGLWMKRSREHGWVSLGARENERRW
jgi:hypothetical protein